MTIWQPLYDREPFWVDETLKAMSFCRDCAAVFDPMPPTSLLGASRFAIMEA